MGSSFSAQRYAGAWLAFAETRSEVAGEALAALLGKIGRLSTEDIPPKDIEESKRAIVAGLAFMLEQPAAALHLRLIGRQLQLPGDEASQYAERVMGISGEDVRKIARTYLDPEAVQIVIVGDAGRLRNTIQAIAPSDKIQVTH